MTVEYRVAIRWRGWTLGEIVEYLNPRCTRCGGVWQTYHVCLRNPNEESVHRMYRYCVECGEQWESGAIHMSEEEWEQLPEWDERDWKPVYGVRA